MTQPTKEEQRNLQFKRYARKLETAVYRNKRLHDKRIRNKYQLKKDRFFKELLKKEDPVLYEKLYRIVDMRFLEKQNEKVNQMGYMHIDNLYKNQDILAFKECY